jgi:cytidylate kinase
VLGAELARRIAERLRCTAADVEAVAEHAPTFLERLAAMFTVVPSDAPILPEPLAGPDPDRLVDATRAVLREAVHSLPLIVIGHGANCLFHGRPDLLRVRVTAPFEVRLRRVAARTGAAPEAAVADVRKRDNDRRHYLERYYRAGVNDPNLYDIQINTGTVSLEGAAELVLALMREVARD